MKKKILIIIFILILLALMAFVIFKRLTKEENKTFSSKDIPFILRGISMLNIDPTKFDNIKQIDETDDKVEEETPIIEEGSNEVNNTSNNSNNNIQNKSVTNNTKTQTQNNSNYGGATTQTPPKQQTTAPSQPSKPKTKWEELGISEEAYYNTPLTDELTAKTDSECMAIVKSLKSQGYVANMHDTLGKYTLTKIGCWVQVYINGREYYYKEAKGLGLLH